MARIVHHRPEDGKPLYDYNSISSYDDCPNRIVCFSERDFNIILNALQTVGEAKTRCYVSEVGANRYEVVSNAQWENFVTYVTTIYNRMGNFMECNEYLSRIADALESMVDHQDKSVLNLFDVLEALGIEADEEQEDILEALQYILSLADIDLLPDFNIPKIDFLKSIGDMRFRGGVINLLQDIAISQRGQAVAQGGVDMVGVYSTVGLLEDKLLLAGGYAGKAIWLWKRIAPASIPGWFSWISTLTGTLFGSIRDATYDVVEAIENLDLAGIAQAIQDQTVSVSVNCSGCGAEAIEDILSNPEIPEGAFVPTDSTWDGGIDPPESEYVEWAETENDSTTRCKAAEFVIDWLRSLFNRNEWALSVQDTAETLATKMAAIFSTSDFILFPITASITLITWIIAGLITTGNTFLQDIADELDEHYDDLVCELVEGSTIAEGAANVRAYLEVNSTLTSFQLNALDVFLKLVNVGGLLYYVNATTATIIDEFPGTCSCETCDELATIGDFGCVATIVDGNFCSEVETEVSSCVSTVFGSPRDNVLIGSTASPTNRLFEVVAVSGANSGLILNWSQGAVPQTQQDWPQLDDIIGLSWEATTLHFIRNTGGSNEVPFTITLSVTEV